MCHLVLRYRVGNYLAGTMKKRMSFASRLRWWRQHRGLLVAPNVLRPFLVNWAEVVRYFIRSVEADAAADGSDETNALLHRLLAYKGVRSAIRDGLLEQVSGPVLPMHFRKRPRVKPWADSCQKPEKP
jgi:hypothetical protein